MTKPSMNTNGTLESALNYLKRGWSVIPVQLMFENGREKASKKPLIRWRDYSKRLPTEDEVRSWWSTYPNAGVGIVTGSVSGVIVVDLDIGYSEANLASLDIPKTLTINTPTGGKHFYLRTTRNNIKSIADLFRDDSHIDVRGEGGFVVAPPSTYPDGRPYTFESDLETTTIANLPEHLEQILKSDLKESSHEQTTLAGVSEGSRNNTATKVAGSLLSTYSENEWETKAWPEMQEWNLKNIPPLMEKELRTTFESIASRERVKQIGVPADGIGEAIVLRDLLHKHFPLSDWAVDSLFETATINMLSAAPNHFKSWIAQHMAFCVASGTKVFGHFGTAGQKVMIVNEEDSERNLRDRSLSLTNEGEDLPVYFHVAKGIKMEESFVSTLLKETREKEIKFVIFDSLRSVHTADENNSKEMQAIMDQFKRFSKEGITVLFTHHNRKKFKGFGSSNESDQNGGEESRGSSSINAAIHGHISCEPKKDGTQTILLISQYKLKCAKKLEPFKVLVDENKETGKIRLTYLGEYDGKLETRSQIMMAVLGALRTAGWLSIQDLMRMDVAGERALREAVRALFAKGDLEGKSRKELLQEGAVIPARGSASEQFYSLSAKEEKTYEDINPGY